MIDHKTSWVATFSLLILILFQFYLGESSIMEDAPYFLENLQSDVTITNLFPKSAKDFLAEKDYRFLIISNVQTHHEDHIKPYTKILSEKNAKVIRNVTPSYMATCGRLLIGDNPYDVIVIEVDNCHDNLMGFAKILRIRFPSALIVFLSPWNPKIYSAEVTDELGNPESKDLVTLANENGYKRITSEAIFLLGFHYTWKVSSSYNSQKECLLNAVHETNGFALVKRDDIPTDKTDNDILFSRVHLYSDDWYTLNQQGENDLARGIVRVLEHMDHPKKDKLGEWPPIINSCRRKRPKNPRENVRRPRRQRPGSRRYRSHNP